MARFACISRRKVLCFTDFTWRIRQHKVQLLGHDGWLLLSRTQKCIQLGFEFWMYARRKRMAASDTESMGQYRTNFIFFPWQGWAASDTRVCALVRSGLAYHSRPDEDDHGPKVPATGFAPITLRVLSLAARAS